jgi:hypothetical protein
MDTLLYPVRIVMQFFLKRAFLKCQRDEIPEEFLELLLKLMGVTFWLDKNLRKHIEGFHGVIQFSSRDNEIKVLAIFKNNRLIKRELKPDENPAVEPNAIIVFKDAEGLMNFLLPKGGQRDILRSILNNEVIINGNWNYIYRFGFIATHLQLQAAKLLT